VVAGVLEACQDTKSGTFPVAEGDRVVYLDEVYQPTMAHDPPNDCSDHSIYISGLRTPCTTHVCPDNTQIDCRILADPDGSLSHLLSALVGP
jgi:hypothetical protein